MTDVESPATSGEFEEIAATLRDHIAAQGFMKLVGAKLNAVHFAIRMAAATSIHVVGCGVRGRSG